jgi:hypothetical protein
MFREVFDAELRRRIEWATVHWAEGFSHENDTSRMLRRRGVTLAGATDRLLSMTI